MNNQAAEKSRPPVKNPGKRLALFPPDTAPRVLLFFFAICLQLIASAVSGVGYSVSGAAYWLAGMILWLVWFVLMFFIATPRTDTLLRPHYGWLKRWATIIFITVFIMGVAELFLLLFFIPGYVKSGADNHFARSLEQLQHGFQYNDGTALSHQAAENLLDGKNPYAHGNIIEAFLKYGGAYDRLTPLRTGRFADVFPYPTREQLKQLWDSAIQDPSRPPPELESGVCYPAGSFLLPTPFIAAGIKDIRIIYAIFVIGGLIYAAWRIPGRRRLLFIGLVIISLELWNSLGIGETGSLVFPFLLIAWVALGKNNWLSAIFMGLAVTTKQLAWFFLPFYLILLWRTANPKAVAATIGIIAGLFIATNACFIAVDPALWLQSVASPMAEPMFPLGVGLASLVAGGLIDVQTALPFSIMEMVVFIGGIFWYLRYGRRYPDAGLILAILPMFFAWRSFWCYFFYVTIIILASILIKEENDAPAALPG